MGKKQKQSGRPCRSLCLGLLLASFAASAVYAAEVEQVRFESLPNIVTAFQRKRAIANGTEVATDEVLSFEGTLTLPTGSPPYTSIILLHGCTSDASRIAAWTETLVAWGYAVLSFDAFKPRGVADICDDPVAVPSFQRAKDIQGAVSYLAERSDMTADKIGALGLTHGGSSLLYALAPYMNRQQARLKAAVALYPICGQFSRFTAPLWAIFGDTRHHSASLRCERKLPRVSSDYVIQVRTHLQKQHPTEYFRITDDGLDDLTNAQTGADQAHLQNLQKFLFDQLN